MNRIYRSGSGVPRPRTITDKTMAAALLPGTAVLIGATLTQARTVSGGRVAILGDRDYYSSQGINTNLDPLMTPYAVGSASWISTAASGAASCRPCR